MTGGCHQLMTKVEEILDALWANRERTKDAAVFRFGCKAIGDAVEDREKAPLMTLLGLLLSSQTHDQTTFAAVQKLSIAELDSPQALAKASVTDIEDAIYPVNFFHRKAANIQSIAARLLQGTPFPRTLDEFQAFPGIGPKMAHLAMQIIYDECHGISVDTHVHRVAGRLGFTSKCKTPEDTRKQLEGLLPRKMQSSDGKEWDVWININPLLVALGQTICLPRRPQCASCFLASICPSSSIRSNNHLQSTSQSNGPLQSVVKTAKHVKVSKSIKEGE